MKKKKKRFSFVPLSLNQSYVSNWVSLWAKSIGPSNEKRKKNETSNNNKRSYAQPSHWAVAVCMQFSLSVLIFIHFRLKTLFLAIGYCCSFLLLHSFSSCFFFVKLKSMCFCFLYACWSIWTKNVNWDHFPAFLPFPLHSRSFVRSSIFFMFFFTFLVCIFISSLPLNLQLFAFLFSSKMWWQRQRKFKLINRQTRQKESERMRVRQSENRKRPIIFNNECKTRQCAFPNNKKKSKKTTTHQCYCVVINVSFFMDKSKSEPISSISKIVPNCVDAVSIETEL